MHARFARRSGIGQRVPRASISMAEDLSDVTPSPVGGRMIRDGCAGFGRWFDLRKRTRTDPSVSSRRLSVLREHVRRA